MANMVDYLSWRGDLTLDERPFNDADALVLSSLSYLDLGGVVPSADAEAPRRAVPLSEALDGLLERAGGDLRPYVRSMASIDATLARAAAASRRLGQALVSGYVDVTDEAASLQFAAMRFDLVPGLSFVALRGTDSSLVGWRENFLLGSRVTVAQRMAASYVRDAAREAARSGTRLLVGGHSKGGNLAEYACVSCPGELRAAIGRCWSFDGPGFDRAIVPADGHDVLGERFRRLQPAYSIVGQLFDRPGEPRAYVASSARGSAQHDPMTWQVACDGSLVAAPGLDPSAALLDEALAGWIASIPLGERERFTNELFDVLGAGGAKTFEEFFAAPLSPQVASAVARSSRQTKEIALRFVQIAAGKGADAVARAVGEGAAEAARRLSGAVGRVGDAVRAAGESRGPSAAEAPVGADDAPGGAPGATGGHGTAEIADGRAAEKPGGCRSLSAGAPGEEARGGAAGSQDPETRSDVEGV